MFVHQVGSHLSAQPEEQLSIRVNAGIVSFDDEPESSARNRITCQRRQAPPSSLLRSRPGRPVNANLYVGAHNEGSQSLLPSWLLLAHVQARLTGEEETDEFPA